MKQSLNIVHDSFKFTLKNYRYFILVFLIFFLSECALEELSEIIPIDYFLVYILLNLIIMGFSIGISYGIVSNLIKNDRPIPKASVHHVTSGLKDRVLEIYYIFLSIIFTVTILSPLIIHNFSLINDVIEIADEFQLHFSDYTILLASNLNSYLITFRFIMILVFSIVFMVFFAFLMIAKIHFEEENNLIESMNVFLIFRKIRKIGYMEFLKIILSMSIVLFTLSFTMSFFDDYLSARIISSLFETLLIFINMRIFTYIYDESNLDEVTDTSMLKLNDF